MQGNGSLNHFVIAVAQQKGGAGKTTIAAHLAIAYSQKRLKVALLDIDPQGSLSDWHHAREMWLGKGHTDIEFKSLSSWRLYSEVQRMRYNYDVIIIDSPPHSDSETRDIVRTANMVIIPMQPSPLDLWATDPILNLTREEGVPAYLLLNRMPPKGKLADTIAKELHMRFKTQIGNRVAFPTAMMEGKCATETEPQGVAAQEIRALSDETVEILKKAPQAEVERKVVPLR